MKLNQYLESRGIAVKSLSMAEAVIIGVPWPLARGWVDKYGGLEITTAMLVALRTVDLEPSAKVRNRMALEFRDHGCILTKRSGPQKTKVKRKRARNGREARKVTRPDPVPARQTKLQSDDSWKRFAPDPRSDEFLASYQWKRARMDALTYYGTTCMCCGASPATGAVMNVDHIKPRKLYPHLALERDNLQVLCGDCNHGKGNWDETDWREEGHVRALDQMYSDPALARLLKELL